jgi:hypothetical protein
MRKGKKGPGMTNAKSMATRTEREYDFTLALDGASEPSEALEDALFDAGCDDATLSFRSGRGYLAFSRSSHTLGAAILSAIRDVRAAKAGVDVLRVDVCDLVTQADIARRIGRTRQLVNQYITGKRGPGGFPPPVCHIADESALWMWCDVAYWLWRNDMIREEDLLDAQQLAGINTVLDLHRQQRHSPALIQEAMQVINARQR